VLVAVAAAAGATPYVLVGAVRVLSARHLVELFLGKLSQCSRFFHSFLRVTLGSARRIAGRSVPDLKFGLWVKLLFSSSLWWGGISLHATAR
jgi:hypothetical protein